MSQSEHRGDRSAVLTSYPDLNFVTHAFDQISEPSSGLWQQSMAPPGNQDEAVEFVQQLFGPTCFVGKPFLLCPPDLALNGIFVESAKNLFQTHPDVELVEAVRTARLDTKSAIVPR